MGNAAKVTVVIGEDQRIHLARVIGGRLKSVCGLEIARSASITPTSGTANCVTCLREPGFEEKQ